MTDHARKRDMTDHERIMEAVQELTRPRQHREPYTVRTPKNTWLKQQWPTEVRSLLDQLGEAIEPAGNVTDGHAVPGSRSPARLEAIDTLLLIDAECSQWISFMELHERPSIGGNLQAILGAARLLIPGDLVALRRNVERWATMARVLTGWEIPARQLYNTCPICAVRGGLRVRVGDGVTSNDASAVCVECRSTWDAHSIGLLAEHIRAENGEDDVDEIEEAS